MSREEFFAACRNSDGSYTVEVGVTLAEGGASITLDAPQISWKGEEFHGTADGCTCPRLIKYAIRPITLLRLNEDFAASVEDPQGEMLDDEARLSAGQRYKVHLRRYQ